MSMNFFQTSKVWLHDTQKKLETAGIVTARLDCLVLLEDATGKDRAWLLANPEYPISNRLVKRLNAQVTRRAKNEPIAYIIGKSYFYGRQFIINKHVLQPRPETEAMIDLLKRLLDQELTTENQHATVIDVGTGSGCLAVTAKLELPEAAVLGTDVSPACLKIAHQNAKQHAADVKFYMGDLLQPVLPFDGSPLLILLANLPYVPDNYPINRSAGYEPPLSIFGGADGLDLYRQLFGQIARAKQRPAHVLTEALPRSQVQLALLAGSGGYRQTASRGLVQQFSLATSKHHGTLGDREFSRSAPPAA